MFWTISLNTCNQSVIFKKFFFFSKIRYELSARVKQSHHKFCSLELYSTRGEGDLWQVCPTVYFSEVLAISVKIATLTLRVTLFMFIDSFSRVSEFETDSESDSPEVLRLIIFSHHFTHGIKAKAAHKKFSFSTYLVLFAE